MSNPLKNCMAIAILFIVLSGFLRSNAQCITTGTKTPASATTVTLSGSQYSFSPPANAFLSDNIMSTANAILSLGSSNTHYLKVSNYGFSIPATAAICGIQVNVEKRAGNLSILGLLESYVIDNMAKLVKNGTILSTNRATSTHWPDTKTVYTYGGPSDLWGASWLPSDINNANFGFAFSAYLNGFILGLVNIFPSAQVDNISMTVYYLPDALLPVRLLNFAVEPGKNNRAQASWTTDQPGNTNYDYVLQRSKDGITWQSIQDNTIETNEAGTHYTTDNSPYDGKSYYRLKMTSKQGAVTYSENKAIILNNNIAVRVFPNPCTQYVQVSGAEKNTSILLYDETGRVVPVPKQITGSSMRLEVGSLKTGIYFLGVDGRRMKILKQ